MMSKRVAALEQGRRFMQMEPIPLIFAAIGETVDQAVERHVAGHGALPGCEPNAIVIEPVVPPRRMTADAI